jgi:hypothetical protein
MKLRSDALLDAPRYFHGRDARCGRPHRQAIYPPRTLVSESQKKALLTFGGCQQDRLEEDVQLALQLRAKCCSSADAASPPIVPGESVALLTATPD